MTIDDDIDPAEFQRMAAKLVAGTRRAPVTVEIRRRRAGSRSKEAEEIRAVECFDAFSARWLSSTEVVEWAFEEFRGGTWIAFERFGDKGAALRAARKYERAGCRITWWRRPYAT